MDPLIVGWAVDQARLLGLTLGQAQYVWRIYQAREKTRVQKERTLGVLKQVGIVVAAGLVSTFLPGIPWWGRLGLGVASGLVDDPAYDSAGLGLAAASPLLTGVTRAVTRQIRSRDMPEADRPSLYGDIIIPALIWSGMEYGPQYRYWGEWFDRFNTGGTATGEVGVLMGGGATGLYAW